MVVNDFLKMLQNHLAKRYRHTCRFLLCKIACAELVWCLHSIRHINHGYYSVFHKYTPLVLSHRKFATDKSLTLWTHVYQWQPSYALGLGSYICRIHLVAHSWLNLGIIWQPRTNEHIEQHTNIKHIEQHTNIEHIEQHTNIEHIEQHRQNMEHTEQHTIYIKHIEQLQNVILSISSNTQILNIATIGAVTFIGEKLLCLCQENWCGLVSGLWQLLSVVYPVVKICHPWILVSWLKVVCLPQHKV